MADNPLAGKVPARYVGNTPIRLLQALGPYYNADGTKRTSLDVSHGDVLMMPAHEIIGQTYLFDPKGNHDPLYLGAGHRILPEHQGLGEQELALLGYEFHGGRSDFELVTDAAPAPVALVGETGPEVLTVPSVTPAEPSVPQPEPIEAPAQDAAQEE